MADIGFEIIIERTQTINSDASIAKTKSETIDSSAYIKSTPPEQTLTSRAFIVKLTEETINSNAYIKTIANVEQITSNSVISKERIQELTSEAIILKVEEETLNSDSYVLDVQTETINSDMVIDSAYAIYSDAFILDTQTETITSDAWIDAAGEKNITSDAFIKVLANEETINSDALIVILSSKVIYGDMYIKVLDNTETIYSDSWINLLQEETITSDSFIEKANNTKTITSNAYILSDFVSKAITSNARIKVLDNEKTLTSDAYISKIEEETITSDSFIVIEREETLTSDSYILNVNEEVLTSDSFIKVIDNQEIINSDSYIYRNISENILSDSYIKQVGKLGGGLGPNSNLVGHWRLNDKTGSSIVVDDTGSHNGTLYSLTGDSFPLSQVAKNTIESSVNSDVAAGFNSPYFDSPNVNNPISVSFGNSSAFSFGNGVIDYPFSISARIYPKIDGSPLDGDKYTIISKYGSGSPEYELSIQYLSGVFRLVVSLYDRNAIISNRLEAVTSYIINPDEWVNVSMTYDGSRTASGLKLYVGGVESGTSAKYGNYISMGTRTGNLRLFSRDNFSSESSANLFEGYLDEVRLYNDILNSSEIKSLSSTGTTSDASIKVFDNEETITSDAVITYTHTEYITSDAYIVYLREVTIDSLSYIKNAPVEHTILGDAHIKETSAGALTSDMSIKRLGYEQTISSDSYIKVTENQETILSDSVIEIVPEETLASDYFVKKLGGGGGVPTNDPNTNTPNNETTLNTFYGIAPIGGFIYRIDLNMRAVGSSIPTRLNLTINGVDYLSEEVSINTGVHQTYTFLVNGRPRINLGDDITVTKVHSGTVYTEVSTLGDNSGWDFHFDAGPIIDIYYYGDITSNATIFKETSGTILSDMLVAESGPFGPDGPTYFFVEETELINSDSVIVEFGRRDILADAYIKKLGETKTITSDGQIHKVATTPFVITVNSGVKPKIIFADVDLNYTRR